jgi:hypothetical protein
VKRPLMMISEKRGVGPERFLVVCRAAIAR